MATLTKSQTVLEVQMVSPVAGVVFTHPDRDAPSNDRSVHSDREFKMSYGDWVQFGYPNKVTISIEPGDKLNQADGDSPFEEPELQETS